MKIFISYRRDDTGGRAGRLFDALVARYGARNVFQDVNAVAPGVDFTEQVGAATAASDVVLVVIGRSWLSSLDPAGGRRIDRDDDFVRQEVGAALATGRPVVPVLVDDATLPPADELPDELHGLVRRNAVALRDVSWHQDVDDLVLRLEGEERGVVRRRRSRVVIVAAAVAVVLAVAVVVAVVRAGDGSGDSSEVPPCPPTDDSWTQVEVLDTPPRELPDGDSTVEFDVVGAWSRAAGDGGTVYVDLQARNVGEPVAGTFDDDVYLSEGMVDGLLVDDVKTEEVTCSSVNVGIPQLAPGERAVGTFGFDTPLDPTGAALAIQVGDAVFAISEG